VSCQFCGERLYYHSPNVVDVRSKKWGVTVTYCGVGCYTADEVLLRKEEQHYARPPGTYSGSHWEVIQPPRRYSRPA